MKNLKNHWYYSLFLLGLLVCISNSCSKDDSPKDDSPVDANTVTDIDGNIYRVVKICDQYWMAENLKVTKFRNGDEIPYVNINDWAAVGASAAYCNFQDSEFNGEIFGHLYHSNTVLDPRNLAPKGWHIPSDLEWWNLIDCLGGIFVAHDLLRVTGSAHWLYNENATNESGFSALPGEQRSPPYYLMEQNLGFSAYFWSSTSTPASPLTDMDAMILSADVWGNYAVHVQGWPKGRGLSVRCLRD